VVIENRLAARPLNARGVPTPECGTSDEVSSRADLSLAALQLVDPRKETLEHFPRLWSGALLQHFQCFFARARRLALLDRVNQRELGHRQKQYLGPISNYPVEHRAAMCSPCNM
jgi:hypothetical protein